jgi:hypothetical protein
MMRLLIRPIDPEHEIAVLENNLTKFCMTPRAIASCRTITS